ncbi:hypothetical protein SISNIDRAFT_480485 [Sistotremastrum niveocremeum HHB9708]|uniref:F-box domain-containing protein n=1 Tax=Sistotremastrum niveocremeum HHB9708 TaxID=1314777 RepID=A0A165AER3_9AGAM|nr:hypothetical protein SISNIDRAFT_480485 [Sistotremastrum niveocremeum HHB9708]
MSTTPHPAQTQMATIPVELYRTIVECLPQDISKADLVNFSLASHAWKAEVDRVLWSRVTMEVPDLTLELLSVLEQQHSRHVRRFTMWLWPDNRYDGTPYVLPECPPYDRIHDLLHKSLQPSLTHLHLHLRKAWTTDWQSWYRAHFPALKTFHFTAMDHNDYWIQACIPEFLARHPGIEEVGIFDGDEHLHFQELKKLEAEGTNILPNLRVLQTTPRGALWCLSLEKPQLEVMVLGKGMYNPNGHNDQLAVLVRQKFPALRVLDLPETFEHSLILAYIQPRSFPVLEELYNVYLGPITRAADLEKLYRDYISHFSHPHLRILTCHLRSRGRRVRHEEVTQIITWIRSGCPSLQHLELSDGNERNRRFKCTFDPEGKPDIRLMVGGSMMESQLPSSRRLVSPFC